MPQFVKRIPAGRPGMSRLEAAGLQWLGECGATVPQVVSFDEGTLVLEWVDEVAATEGAARAFGAQLARVHRRPAPPFGSPPPGTGARSGWVGQLPVPFGEHESWPQHYVEDRLRPAAAAAIASGGLTNAQDDAISGLCDLLLSDPEVIAGPATPPAPIHGDLWSGNVLWQPTGAVLVDPAAVAGHPETDLAMLHLFGLPYLAEVVAGYESVRPLATGWQRRIALHQVFPLLVHAALFGGHYGAAATRAATQATSIIT